MARPGPAQQARRLGHSANADWTEVHNRPYTGASPDLPKLPNRCRYHPMVTTWWDMVRQMPHCVRWAATDWQFAVETALLKHYFWTDAASGEVKTTAATEIRRREDQMGTTAEALRKLRIRYMDVDEDDLEDEDAEPGEQPQVTHQRRAGGGRPVTSLASRRARALGEQQGDQAGTA